jgi:molybdopterin/thiamine biosynthesis adenylyltransferase
MTHSDRHEGDLGGKLRPFGEANAGIVVVRVEPDHADSVATQHTVWMLANLLCRLDGIVDEVIFDIPEGVALRSNVIPLTPESTDLLDGITIGTQAIGIVAARAERGGDPVVVVGPGSPLAGAFRCYGGGWQGGISRAGIDPLPESELPIGPYIAACMAAGEIFARARFQRFAPTTSAWYCAWSQRGGPVQHQPGPSAVDVELAHAIIGVGAVGSTIVQALWATPGVRGAVALVDGDEKGVEETNLNRYPLFGQPHIGAAKAAEASRIAAGCSIAWTPHDASIEKVDQSVLETNRIVSAVDLNRPRHVIQSRYPTELLSASTLDLRAEILRCGPPGEGACLACFNPPEPGATDEDLRKHVGDLSTEERQKLADETDQTVTEVDAWVTTGRCGRGTPRLLERLRQADELPANFAVGFVSVMSGTLLTAELLKADTEAPALSADAQHASFQFFNQASERNGANFLGRDPNCSRCRPGEIATEVWRSRWQAL